MAALVILLGSVEAHAASDPCGEARRLVGEQAGTMSRDDCQEVVDAAEEERWQLWLDMALAHEHSGDDLAAVQYYGRFIESADLRPRPLSPSWAKVRSDALAAVARLDAELRATLGRVDVRSTPGDAAASFEGKATETASLVTPFTTYLAPGEHTLELYHPSLPATVRKAFTLEKGQVLALDLDLAAELAAAKAAPGPKTTTTPTKALPPVAEPATNVLETVGWLGVAAGVGLLATGTVLYVDGQGRIDATACTTEPWCAPTASERARRKDDGESTRRVGVITWIAGGALLAAGIVAVVLSDDDADDDGPDGLDDGGPRLQAIAPTFMPDGSPGVGAALSF